MISEEALERKLNMKILFILINAIFILYGCGTPVANYKVLRAGTVDKADKTITVPSVGFGIFEIKDALIKNGWKIKVDNATLEEKGVKSESISTSTKTSFDTACRLYMTSTQSSNENLGIVTFNLSVVNNKTNEEILTMAGNREDYVRYDPEEIASRLIGTLSILEK